MLSALWMPTMPTRTLQPVILCHLLTQVKPAALQQMLSSNRLRAMQAPAPASQSHSSSILKMRCQLLLPPSCDSSSEQKPSDEQMRCMQSGVNHWG